MSDGGAVARVRPDVRDRLLAQTTQLWGEPGVIDLGIGQPQDALLPVELMSRALREAAAAGRRHPLQYGTERGDGHLRAALADFLAPRYQAPVDPDLMLITNGNSQGIDLCCGAFTAPGDVVLVEEPTYFLARQIFADHGLRVVGIEMDGDGLRPEALERALAELAPARPRLLYTIPTAHNPTGATLPPARRRRIVELAVEHDFLVVADEVYHLLQYTGEPPPPLAAHVDSGVVISLGTFSKILAPGLRLGWAQAAGPLLQRLERRGFLVSGGGLNPFSSALVAPLLDDGSAAAHLAWLCDVLADRAQVMDVAIRAHLPRAQYVRPGGGYFFWLRLPPGVDTAAVRPRALHLGAGFQPGPAFSTGGGLRDHLRLSFAYYGSQEIRTAVAAIGRAFEADAGNGSDTAGHTSQ